MRYEMARYLLVVVSGITGIIKKRWVMLPIAVLVTIWSVAQLAGWVPTIPPFAVIGQSDKEIPRLAACFLAGMAYAAFGQSVRYNWGGVLAAALALWSALYFPIVATAIIPWAGGYLLLAAAFGPVVPGTALIRREDISYGLYLYAWPVAQLVISRWRTINPWLLVLINLLIAGSLGFLSWRLVEKLGLRFSKGLSARYASMLKVRSGT